MVHIFFKLDDSSLETPNEYTMGHLTIESDGVKLESECMSGRGLMMVFFSITSLLEAVVKLSQINVDEYKFVGEDSSFILYFKKGKNGNINVIKEKTIFFELKFDEMVKAIWSLSESFLNLYGDQMRETSAAKKDWIKVRGEVASLLKVNA